LERVETVVAVLERVESVVAVLEKKGIGERRRPRGIPLNCMCAGFTAAADMQFK
jgi:hypothetical protein